MTEEVQLYWNRDLTGYGSVKVTTTGRWRVTDGTLYLEVTYKKECSWLWALQMMVGLRDPNDFETETTFANEASLWLDYPVVEGPIIDCHNPAKE